MVNPWVRLHREALHNPKIVLLSDRQHRVWHNLLLIADDEGQLPPFRELACHLRLPVTDCEQLVSELVENGLVDLILAEGPPRYRLHDWETHQFKSDSSAERTRKYRENKHKNYVTEAKRHSDGVVTPSDTDTDTDKKPSSSTFPISAREKNKGIIVDFEKGKEGKAYDTLTRRAEGLGLPIDELVATLNRQSPKNRTAYFTKLCVTRLKEQLPGILDGVLRDALWGKQPAYADVCAALIARDAPCKN